MKKINQGKVRSIYDVGDGRLVIETSNDISAFDVVLPNKVPHKGQVLNALSAFWFNFTGDVMPNHMISIDPDDMPIEFQCSAHCDGNIMLVKKLKMLPIECIVRGYITGSGWSSYKKNGQVCGITLPVGLQESEKLPEPIYTPTTKATSGHDEHISFSDTVHLLGADIAKQLRDRSIEIYKLCSDYAAKKGIIIADTKFEFGVDENGVVTLADEVLTPDSSRFWPLAEYEVGRSQKSFDKQLVRDWLSNSGWNKEPPAPQLPDDIIEATERNYLAIYEMITGKELLTF